MKQELSRQYGVVGMLSEMDAEWDEQQLEKPRASKQRMIQELFSVKTRLV